MGKSLGKLHGWWLRCEQDLAGSGKAGTQSTVCARMCIAWLMQQDEEEAWVGLGLGRGGIKHVRKEDNWAVPGDRVEHAPKSWSMYPHSAISYRLFSGISMSFIFLALFSVLSPSSRLLCHHCQWVLIPLLGLSSTLPPLSLLHPDS